MRAARIRAAAACVLLCASAAAVQAQVQSGGAIPAASLASILSAPEDRGLRYQLYRWDRFPSILVFDTADFDVQNRMFSRLAYFVEKRGYRGRLLTNEELAPLHGWNAHDYSGQGLAAFFEAVRRTGFPLNPEERELREIALAEGILLMARGTYRAGDGALISISRGSSRYERRFLLTHESFHGIFFVSPDYRELCFRLWDSLSSGERAFFTAFFALLGYDASDTYLCVNELQAYLMQQPVRLVPEYFERNLKRFPDVQVPSIEPSRLQAVAGALAEFLAARLNIEPGGTTAARPAGEARP